LDVKLQVQGCQGFLGEQQLAGRIRLMGDAIHLNPVETHATVAAMAEAYAQRAVSAAQAMNEPLDFTEQSLIALEAILDRLCRRPEAGDLNETCKLWGSYLGEVVRRRYGGEWSIETYPGKQFATLTLSVHGNKLFPTMKVHRRLTAGESDNVWQFYQMIKARMETLPGGKVQ
jgi:hypothetical protein